MGFFPADAKLLAGINPLVHLSPGATSDVGSYMKGTPSLSVEQNAHTSNFYRARDILWVQHLFLWLSINAWPTNVWIVWHFPPKTVICLCTYLDEGLGGMADMMMVKAKLAHRQRLLWRLTAVQYKFSVLEHMEEAEKKEMLLCTCRVLSPSLLIKNS